MKNIINDFKAQPNLPQEPAAPFCAEPDHHVIRDFQGFSAISRARQAATKLQLAAERDANCAQRGGENPGNLFPARSLAGFTELQVGLSFGFLLALIAIAGACWLALHPPHCTSTDTLGTNHARPAGCGDAHAGSDAESVHGWNR